MAGSSTSFWSRRDGDARLSPDGRWRVSPAMRPVMRGHINNTTGQRRDGWILTDALTGARRRVDTLADAMTRAEWADNYEQETARGSWAAWTCDLGGRPPVGLHEVRLVPVAGINTVLLGLIGATGDAEADRQRALALLAHVGLGELPYRSR